MKTPNGLFRTLRKLKGNPRICLYTEPLWGIPANLYMPLSAVYMAALGLSPVDIGLVASLGFLSQTVFALLSGALTDKLGRRLCTFLVDLIAWSVPTLLWMNARGTGWFIAAALCNGAWKVTENSWGLLMVEDAPQDQIIHLYTWASIAGLAAGFVTPFTYFLLNRFSLIPVMRGLYLFAFISMTAKFVLLFIYSTETRDGALRKAALKGKSLLEPLRASLKAIPKMLKNPAILKVIGLLTVSAVLKNNSDNFWPLLIKDKLLFPESFLSLFGALRAILMILAYFTLIPRLKITRFVRPLTAAMILSALSSFILLFLPFDFRWFIIFCIAIDALSLSVINPLLSSLQVFVMEPDDRAQMMGLSFSACLFLTVPFSFLSGLLSKVGRALPLILSFLAALIAIYLGRGLQRDIDLAQKS